MNMYYIIFMMILRDFALLGMRPKCLSLLASLLSQESILRAHACHGSPGYREAGSQP